MTALIPLQRSCCVPEQWLWHDQAGSKRICFLFVAKNQTELVQIATGNMRVIWNAPIEMDDNTVLRADVFLPEKEGKYPVIITLGPYGKGLSFQTGYKGSWDRIVSQPIPRLIEVC